MKAPTDLGSRPGLPTDHAVQTKVLNLSEAQVLFVKVETINSIQSQDRKITKG